MNRHVAAAAAAAAEFSGEIDGEDCFHDSLDRILSCSNSSTSGSDSDDEDDNPLNRKRGENRTGVTGSTSAPVSAEEKYGVWITESFSCSVEQRRDRLLRSLGLAGDSALSRRSRLRRCDLNRSLSAEQLRELYSGGVVVGLGNCIVRSKSEGLDYRDYHCCSLFVRRACGSSGVSNGNNSDGIDENRTNEIRKDYNVDLRGERMECDCVGGEKVYRIKNLDNGSEFVVNEVRGDVNSKKVREVGTGRQLTMEEFEMCVGHSPIVQELMRRQNVEDDKGSDLKENVNGENGAKMNNKKRVGWLKSIKSVTSSVKGRKERRSSDEKDSSSEKGDRRSSSSSVDSQDVSFHGPERVRVRQYGKSVKEMSALFKCQEIHAHNGSIWTIKFSLDGRLLATAGEDRVIHVWQVVESRRKGELSMDGPVLDSLNLSVPTNGALELSAVHTDLDFPFEKKRRGRRASFRRKSMSADQIVSPETIFGLLEKPICSFLGHQDDVLDLSWSKSQLLLSSSIDKTVRLWSLSSKSCLKVFSHSDYVTCIQFNPVDDRYFISGSLDGKVRIWSIPDHKVVDWNDLHEMVTAACYTPDGQGALVGTYKGSCRLYNTSENKLQQKDQINLQNKKKKAHLKKITGFQFAPGSSSEVLITSADSRIRVIDNVDLVHMFKGFRNTNSQISAAISTNGKYVVSASEDSHVYFWNHEDDSRRSRSKGVPVTSSYEHFHCQDVYVAVPWPGTSDVSEMQNESSIRQNGATHNYDEVSSAHHPPTPVEEFNGNDGSPTASGRIRNPFRGTISSVTNSYFFDRIAATWPEEKLLQATRNPSPCASLDLSNVLTNSKSAWGMVIVTAGLGGKIRTFQNFGLPVRI
ncbi:hypothetical protein Droror1_Dr00015037 [Drosera rotundifolia]